MKLIKSSFEVLEQSYDLEGLYKHLERIYRLCYDPEYVIPNSTISIISNLIYTRKYNNLLEHATIYLKMPFGEYDKETNLFSNELRMREYLYNEDSYVSENTDENYWYITTNYAIIVKYRLESDLKYLCGPTEFHKWRTTAHLVCDQDTFRKYVRYKPFSVTRNITREYTELTFIDPDWSDKLCNAGNERNNDSGYSDIFTREDLIKILKNLESCYTAARIAGLDPLESGAILPNLLKVDVIVTGFVSDWKNFLGRKNAKELLNI